MIQKLMDFIEKIKAFLESWKAEDATFQCCLQIAVQSFYCIVCRWFRNTALSNTDIDASVQFILQITARLQSGIVRQNECVF